MDRFHLALGAAATFAAGALAAQFLVPGSVARAAESAATPTVGLQVINGKSSDTLIFVLDQDTKRLLMYSTGGTKLKLASVRNTAYDAKIQELNNDDEKGTSVREVKKAVDEEEKRK
jgi:hypothetical protein